MGKSLYASCPGLGKKLPSRDKFRDECLGIGDAWLEVNAVCHMIYKITLGCVLVFTCSFMKHQ